MNTNDLRLGNLVYWDIPEKINIPHKVIEINSDSIWTRPISLGDSIDDYKPIPLTEELILKCGFIKITKNTVGEFVYRIPDVQFFLYVQYVQKNERIGFIGRNKWFLYLHELQNFYYAWFGEELEVNL